MKPNKVKVFIPRYAWDSRGKHEVNKYGENWAAEGWINLTKSFSEVCPGLIKVTLKEPNAIGGDMFAYYDAYISTK